MPDYRLLAAAVEHDRNIEAAAMREFPDETKESAVSKWVRTDKGREQHRTSTILHAAARR